MKYVNDWTWAGLNFLIAFTMGVLIAPSSGVPSFIVALIFIGMALRNHEKFPWSKEDK